MTDPITDMLNQIKNAQAVGKTEILVPASKIKNEIAMILVKENFLGEVKKAAKGDIKGLKIILKYLSVVFSILKGLWPLIPKLNPAFVVHSVAFNTEHSNLE